MNDFNKLGSTIFIKFDNEDTEHKTNISRQRDQRRIYFKMFIHSSFIVALNE